MSERVLCALCVLYAGNTRTGSLLSFHGWDLVRKNSERANDRKSKNEKAEEVGIHAEVSAEN